MNKLIRFISTKCCTKLWLPFTVVQIAFHAYLWAIRREWLRIIRNYFYCNWNQEWVFFGHVTDDTMYDMPNELPQLKTQSHECSATVKKWLRIQMYATMQKKKSDSSSHSLASLVVSQLIEFRVTNRAGTQQRRNNEEKKNTWNIYEKQKQNWETQKKCTPSTKCSFTSRLRCCDGWKWDHARERERERYSIAQTIKNDTDTKCYVDLSICLAVRLRGCNEISFLMYSKQRYVYVLLLLLLYWRCNVNMHKREANGPIGI